MTEPLIDSSKVHEAFMDCLFRDEEDHKLYTEAHGLTCNVGFHPERLESHRAEVVGYLSNLPNSFKKTGGGGMSFLNACNDKNGTQWTDFHKIMEELFLLGSGLKIVSFPIPRELWDVLPGGMPYVTVDVP